MKNELAPMMLIFFYNIVLPLIVGYILKKITKLDKKKFDVLIKINIAIIMPITVVLVYWNMNFSKDMIYLPIIGFVIPLFGGLFGYLFSKNRYESSREKGSYVICAMLSNRKTLGGLSAYIIFGEIAYVYMNLMLLFNDITNYVIGHPLGHYYGHRDIAKSKTTLKQIVFRITNVGILAIIIGITLNLSGIERPDYIVGMVDKMIKVAAWVALLPIGASIELSNIKKHYKNIPSLFLIKFVLLPMIAALIAIPLLTDTIAIATVIILSISPVAITSVVVAKMNNLEESITINAFLVTTLFFLVVIFPIILVVLQYINI